MPFAIERNDLSAVVADAIVVAANERLQITGGVGLTVARAAGLEELQAACDEIGFCPCGCAVATPAFALNANIVVHAVGPMWQGGDLGEADFLRSAYDAALECAASHGARSVALPLLSAGTYGFPAGVSLAVARESIRAFLNRRDEIDVRLVLYSRESVAAGMAAYLDIAEYVDDHHVDTHPAYLARGAEVLEAPHMADSCPPAQAAARTERSRQAPGQDGRGPLGRLGSALVERLGGREGRADGHDIDSAAVGPTAEPVPASETPSLAIEPDADYVVAGASEHAVRPSLAFDELGAPTLQDVRDGTDLADLLESLDAPFSTTLLALIDERGMTDAQVYKRANMSRQLFSKIRSDADYRPTKKTALALAVALGLNLDETSALLARAGFALSSSSKADVIVEYFISRGNHDIFEINEALYAFDQPIL